MKVFFNEVEIFFHACEIMRQERKVRHLTQQEMATHLGISQSALSKIEKCKVVPTLIAWLRFCCLFDLPSDLPINVKRYRHWEKSKASVFSRGSDIHK